VNKKMRSEDSWRQFSPRIFFLVEWLKMSMAGGGQEDIASIFQGCIFFLDPDARLFVREGEQTSQDFALASADKLAEQITKRGGTVLSGGFNVALQCL